VKINNLLHKQKQVVRHFGLTRYKTVRRIFCHKSIQNLPSTKSNTKNSINNNKNRQYGAHYA